MNARPDDRGIVRAARRPPGWRAPGPTPPPRAPEDRGDLGPHADEDLCWLAGEWRILQKLRGHRWSLDDLVTSWFAAELRRDDPPATIVDLGCGIGTVLLLLAWRFPAARCIGVEAQGVSVDLARRSITWNGAGDRCVVHHGDLRDSAVLGDGARFGLVTATPPYLPASTAVASSGAQRAACRLELRGGVEAYCEAAARLLAADGAFVTCAGAAQLDRLEAAAHRVGLTISARLDVVPRAGKPPLFLVASLARSAGPSLVLEPLVVRDTEGRRTETFRALRAAMGMPP